MAPSLHAQLLRDFQEDEPDFERAWRLQEARAQGRRLPEGVRDPITLQYRHMCALGEQIRRFTEEVPQGQRLILLLDDMADDPAGTYRSALRFLDLPDEGRIEFPVANRSRYHRSFRLARLHHRLPRLFGPFYAPARAAGRRLGLSQSRANLRQRPRKPLRPAMRAELAEAFAAEIALLSRLLDRDLSHWLAPP